MSEVLGDVGAIIAIVVGLLALAFFIGHHWGD